MRTLYLLALSVGFMAVFGCGGTPTGTPSPEASRPAEAPKATPPAEKPRLGEGPFGLEMGLTAQQLQAAGVKLTTTAFGLYTATSLPNGDSRFKGYQLAISPKLGLCRLIAIGSDVTMNDFGTQLKGEFERMAEAVTKKYGQPTSSFDRLLSGSIWNEPKDWAMALLKEERTLASLWQFKPARQADHIKALALQAKATSTSKGYLTLYYEFQNSDECLAEIKAAEDAKL